MPSVGLDERETSAEHSAFEVQIPSLFGAASLGVTTPLDDADPACSPLDGTLIGQKPHRMVEDGLGFDGVIQDGFRRLGQPERLEDILAFEHEVPMDPIRGGVFLNDEPLFAHALFSEIHNILAKRPEQC